MSSEVVLDYEVSDLSSDDEDLSDVLNSRLLQPPPPTTPVHSPTYSPTTPVHSPTYPQEEPPPPQKKPPPPKQEEEKKKPRSLIVLPEAPARRPWSRIPMVSADDARRRLWRRAQSAEKRAEQPSAKRAESSEKRAEQQPSAKRAESSEKRAEQPAKRAEQPAKRPPVIVPPAIEKSEPFLKRRRLDVRYTHQKTVGALCIRSDGLTFSNGLVAFSSEAHDGSKKLLEVLAENRTSVLFATDRPTKLQWREITAKLSAYHPANAIKIVVLDEQQASCCIHCGRKECHRWLAVAFGISRILHYPVDAIKH